MAIAEFTTRVQPVSGAYAPNDCTHCGLPVPKGLIERDSREQFCCSGCKTAYHLIHSNGLDAFYSMAENEFVSLNDRDSTKTDSQFAEFDQPLFLEKFGRTFDNNINEMLLLLDGIHCAACIWLIEKLPRMVPGVLDVKLNWTRRTVRIRWNACQTRLSRVAMTLHQLGYTPHPVRDSENESRRQRENRQHLARIGIAAAAAGNNMLIVGALYLGMFSYMSVDMTQLLRTASCCVGLAALLWPGRVFLRGAISAFRTRTPHMDLPIALGLTMGSIAGVINTIRGTGEIWFDSLSVLIFLLLVGRWVQFRQQNRAADAVELLYRLTPKSTRKIVNGTPVETFVDLVAVGDLLEIRAGDVIPVDGVMVEGTAEVDESILSGESRLLRKKIGDSVLAGTTNQNSVVVIEATATGMETRLSKIVEQVEQAAMDRPTIVEWANRIGGYFVMSVIAMAAITFLTWLWIDASVAVDRTVALLIVACPCALALATPLAISVGLGRAAKRKIMIKGGDVIQLLNRPGMIWLDKTGTLTEGQLEVVRWYGDTQFQPLVGLLESKSSHPVANAITSHIQSEHVIPQLFEFEEIQEHVGKGMKGRFLDQTLLVGNERLLSDNDVLIANRFRRIAERILSNGFSPCWIAVNQTVISIVALGEQIRDDTKLAIDQIKSAGWKVGILSGDHEEVVQRVANRLGIDGDLAFGGMRPEDKVAIVHNNQDQTVVMVGDGVNDSAALAAASVGIAVHHGAEASLAAAPVYLAEAGLAPILKLLSISRSTGKTIRSNFIASVGYNLLGATFAATGFVNPLVAAILMPISSLTVVAISLTAGKTKTAPQGILANSHGNK